MARARRAAATLGERPDPSETVRYVSLMAAYLRKMAADDGQEFLAYLLAMAESEAKGIMAEAEKDQAEPRSA